VKRPSVADCRLLALPRMTDPRGSLTFIEGARHVPFEIRRLFYIYDVPTGESRGAHSHHRNQQFFVCISGSFDVELDDGAERRVVHLNRPWTGLHVPAMIWAAETSFDPGSVCLVLASEPYAEADYIRDYGEYLRLARAAG
jgi:hypothetical protein